MKINTIEEAMHLAINYITQGGKQGKDNPPKIKQEQTQEYSWGWIFHYNSKAFLETGNIDKAYLGSTPLIVDKIDGTIRSLCGSSPLFNREEELYKYMRSKGYL